MKTAYWGIEANNFGDVLNKNILDYFNIKYQHTTDFHKGDLFAIGSVARLVKKDTSIVFGAGAIKQSECGTYNPNCNWQFVRGPITRDFLIKSGGKCKELYCDLALFLPNLINEQKKEYDIGIVPHYQHFNYLNSKYKDTYKIINVNNKNPLKVAEEIGKCKKVISSSLHGIICSHALNVPAAYLSRNLHGDGTKFLDYYKAVGVECVPSQVNKPIYSDIKIWPDFDLIREIITKTLQQER